MPVTMTKDISAQILKRVRELAKKEVLVGIPASNNARDDSPIGNAAIGYIQEHGDPEHNLPARPFLVPGVTAALPAATVRLKKAAQDAIQGRDPTSGLQAAGLAAEVSVKETINNVIPPPLAPSTLAQRQAKGFTGETPLLRKGDLRDAVTHVVTEKGS